MTLSTSGRLFAAMVILAACSHATTQSGVANQTGASKSASARCALSSSDSAFFAGGIVFRDCAVDRQARLLSSRPLPDFQLTRPPTGGGSCYEAQIEFVVGTDGSPEVATARVVRSNDTEYGRAFLATLPRRRYQPAMKDNAPVREILTDELKAAVMIAPAGSKPSGRPPVC